MFLHRQQSQSTTVVYKFSCPGCRSTYIGKANRTLFIQTYERCISDKESAIYKHLHTCANLIFKWNLCNLLDTLNSDNVPPDHSCDKEYFTQLIETTPQCKTVHDQDWNLLLYKEAYYIKCLMPSLNKRLKSSRELCFFS